MRKFIMALLAILLAVTNTGYAEENVAWELVGQYEIKWARFNVNAIPAWQHAIYKEEGVQYDTMLLMRAVNQLECWDQDWFCLGLNAADAGPFQINRIHKQDYEYSAMLVKRGREQVEEAKRSKNWEWVIVTRNELFRFQVRWTFDRMKRLAKQFAHKVDYYSLPRHKQVWYQAVWHNGNTKIKYGKQFRFYYWDKAVKAWQVLSMAQGKEYRTAPAKKSPKLAAEVSEPEPAITETPEFPELEAAELSIDPPAKEGFIFPLL